MVVFNRIRRWIKRRQIFCDHFWKYDGYTTLTTQSQTPVVRGVLHYKCYFCRKMMKHDAADLSYLLSFLKVGP